MRNYQKLSWKSTSYRRAFPLWPRLSWVGSPQRGGPTSKWPNSSFVITIDKSSLSALSLKAATFGSAVLPGPLRLFYNTTHHWDCKYKHASPLQELVKPRGNLSVQVAQKAPECHIGSEVFMDLFWLVPTTIVVIAFCWGLYAYLWRTPSSPSTPNVLVDKPADKPAIDPAITARDWSTRPAGSYLDWLASHKPSDAKSGDGTEIKVSPAPGRDV